MTQLAFQQQHEQYGRETFSALSTAFCENPEMSEITSGLVFPQHPVSFLSVEQAFELQVYNFEEPTLIVALSECESFAHALQRQDLLTVLCQAEFPIISFLERVMPRESEALVECLCYESEFLSENIEEHINEFQQHFKAYLKAIAELRLSEAELEALADDIRCQAVNRPLFLEEAQFCRAHDTQAFYKHFMERLGRTTGAITALVKGTPFALGKGEYVFFGRSFEEIRENMAPCPDACIIDSLVEERVQATHCELNAGKCGFITSETGRNIYEVKTEGTTVREAEFCEADGRLEFALKDEFAAKVYYLLANAGSLEINGKRMLVPGQYLVSGDDRVTLEGAAGMLDPRTPCFILLGQE